MSNAPEDQEENVENQEKLPEPPAGKYGNLPTKTALMKKRMGNKDKTRFDSADWAMGNKTEGGAATAPKTVGASKLGGGN